MSKRKKQIALAVGTATVLSLSYMQLPQSDEELFMMDEVARDYWLKGGLGLCGAKMKPDLPVIKDEALKGNTIAAFRLGQLYEDGSWGVMRDIVEATKWFRVAAEGGLYDAQIYMGRAYEQGNGVDVDTQQALEWYWKAVKQQTSPFLEEKIRLLESEK